MDCDRKHVESGGVGRLCDCAYVERVRGHRAGRSATQDGESRMSALDFTPYFSEASATEGFRCGDVAAFEWLASRYRDKASGVARTILRDVSPDVVANGRLIERMVWRALGELPPQQRRVAALFFIDGCAHAEIAKTMSLAEGTVRAHLSFARKRLRVVLAEMAD
ncbi:MAG: polymerase sigma factor SigM [Acidobacteria bacterium]|nr:polymerase sigma factor SigM [Acidobacteriota bacterium]